MRSSKWTRQNKERGAQGFLAVVNTLAVSIVILAIIAFATDWEAYFLERFGLSLYFLVLLLACIGSLGYWLFLKFSHTNEMSRVIKMPYEDADFALRKLYKDKQLTFVRRKNEEGCYVYAFTGRDVSLIIYPYDSETSSMGSPDRPSYRLSSFDRTLLQLPGLHPGNKPFAEELALSIDEMLLI